jgi:hypothetical protein
MNCSLTASRQPSWSSGIQASTCFRGGMSFITEVEGHYPITQNAIIVCCLAMARRAQSLK